MVMVIMPGTYEPPERTNLRARLRGVLKDIANTQQHVLPRDMITTEHMVLDIDSQFRPKFFDPDVANLLHVPDDNYDRFNNIQFHNYDSLDDDGRRPMDCAQLIDDYLSLYISTHRFTYNWSQVGVGKFPFVGLHRFTSPEFRTADLVEVKGGDHPHLKAVIFNDLNGTNGQILLGEAMVALRLMNAQLRRARYIKHMMAPVLLFSFMGPQHARLIETFFDGNSFVMRLTKLYDLRTKDEAALKLFAQWYLGKPRGATTTVPNRCDSEYCM